MRYILAVLGILIPILGAAQSTVVYQNSAWAVVHADRQGFSSHCFIVSGGSFVKDQTHADSRTFLVVFQNNILLFTGENIPGYFEQADKVTIQTGDTKGIEIPTNAIFSGIVIVNDMLSGDHEIVTVTLDFTGRESDVHTFPVDGFQQAYTRQLQCNVTANEGKSTKAQIVEMGVE